MRAEKRGLNGQENGGETGAENGGLGGLWKGLSGGDFGGVTAGMLLLGAEWRKMGVFEVWSYLWGYALGLPFSMSLELLWSYFSASKRGCKWYETARKRGKKSIKTRDKWGKLPLF
jgi:hypothetical protein